MLVAHEVAEHAWKGAVGARMWMTVTGVAEPPVGGDHDLRMAHDATHVAFVEHVIDRVRTAPQLGFDDERSPIRRGERESTPLCPIGERLPFQRRVPQDARKLDAPEVAAATVVDDIEDDVARDTVLECRIADATREG